MLLHIQCVRNTPTLHVLYHTYNTIRLHTLCCTCFSIRTKKYKLLEIHQTVHAVQYMPSYTYHTSHNILIVLTICIQLQILYFIVLDCSYYTTLRYYATVFRTIYYTFIAHATLCMPDYTVLHHWATRLHITHYIYTSLCYPSIICVVWYYASRLHTLLSWYTTLF